ncbi:MAG: 2-amino-4-hydroxy-6-hydroxymethyldihydropteridine diphosphokinase [Balneola sp.]|jgi:2-amino-4-hydroxy-6-hydroxymethyldihydropteridine diphosphokinase|nr:2-amino-4-hydroxy-6-hydroxymethyldihydropteridine diphosphokinase [Balneola sp.]MBE79105.1 2-amino-4-hydroxy-6-hydroxymethyldihydropteridine diphosphokinase [Balneola sp.]|tara:strand:+ start:218 stop:706 length:489 start_codon:yes stop_codon:yes gene_type:complete
MAQVVIALGSNLNDPHQQLQKASAFLENLSDSQPQKSSIYKSEPVGPSENDFLNGVIVIETDLSPEKLFEKLKAQEKKQGRPSRYPKWTARTIDLDIIAYDNLVIETDSLIIPHQEYTRRLFVLLPLSDVFPQWKDPNSAQHINALIEEAPSLKIVKTTLNW